MWQSLSEKRPKMLSQRYQKVLLAIFILAGIAFISFSLLSNNSLRSVELASLIGENHPLVKFLSDGTYKVQSFAVDDERMRNSKSEQIFFLETHLEGRRRLDNPRHACSIESAARANPDKDIYFFLTTNESRVVMEHTPLLDALLSYPNVHFRSMNIEEFTKGTRVEEFFRENRVGKSEHRIEHTSDIIRIVALNKYGGLYLDLDVISLFPLRIINKKNFICSIDNDYFANAIIKLDKDEGRKYSEKYFDLLLEKYNPDQYDINGPRMVSEAFHSFCMDTKLRWNITGMCDNLVAWGVDKCCLYLPGDFRKFYEEKYRDEALHQMTLWGGFFIHIWNKVLTTSNSPYKLSYESKAFYLEAAKVYCPKSAATINYFK